MSRPVRHLKPSVGRSALPRILETLSEAGFDCMPTHRREVEVSEHHETTIDLSPAQVPFENPPLTGRTYTSELPPTNPEHPSLFRYFLDGSRRVFSIAEVVVERRYYPILAGQVGVGVIERQDDGKLKPLKDHCSFRNLIVFPDTLGADDYKHIEKRVNENGRFKFSVLKYRSSKLKEGGTLSDLGIAMIMRDMHETEIDTVRALAESGALRDDRMLMIDGGLQFGDQKKIDPYNFRNVAAVAKTFQPNVKLGKGRGRYDIGTLAKNLDYGDRTYVFGQKFKKVQLANWYLKLRPQKYMHSPLQGVAKVEVIAVGRDEEENGIDQSRVSNICKSILSERNVTPYGKDNRWAVHLYPIFQVEQYLKSRFANPSTLMGAF